MSDTETYQKGKFSLTEWEDVNYCEHYFSIDDEQLDDKEVIDLLNEQDKTVQLLHKEIQILWNAIIVRSSVGGWQEVIHQSKERIGDD